MRILICEYENNLNRDMDYEIQIMKELLPDVEVAVKEYIDEEQLKEDLEGVDGLLSVFIPINKKVLDEVKDLKAISLSSTGYENVELEAATANNIYVACIQEYCTEDVAEHTLAIILSLTKNLRYYHNQIEKKHLWKFDTIQGNNRLANQTLALFGLGRIGRAVAVRAQAFGMKVVAVDPFIDKGLAKELDVEIVDREYVQKHADIISNHMNSSDENKYFFDKSFFEGLKKVPYFINVSRGNAVNEQDLVDALDRKLIKGAGLDVLESESPELEGHPLLMRDNVIITPHAAFYSKESMEALKRISATNLVKMLQGKIDEVFGLKNSF